MESLYLITGDNGVGKDFLYSNRKNIKDYFNTIPQNFKFDKDPDTYQRLAFADHIKKSLGVPDCDLTNSGLPRQVIIDEANRLKMLYGEDIFVDVIIKEILQKNIKNVIITDLRFENEYTKMKKIFPYLKIISINI